MTYAIDQAGLMTQVQPMVPVKGQPFAYQRAPVGGPSFPYDPQVFSTLYMWWAILLGVGLATSWFFIGIPAVIAAIVLRCVIMYKAWNQVQDGYQRTTPGKAVGFCFIPFFNFYWIFVAYHGLAQDINSYMRRNAVPGELMSEGLALTYCILVLCCIIPWAGFLSMVAVIVINFIMVYQVKMASAAIAQFKLGGHAPGQVARW
jgi:hypothetical protein